MKQYAKRGLAIAASGISALAITGAPLQVLATQGQAQVPAVATYSARLKQLNNSGVSGRAHLLFKEGEGADTLRVNLHALGTTPNKTHPVHIHGRNHPEVAFCPTAAQDDNRDGFVSVIEGAETYGPIKFNLTSPQTPFGPGPTPALFTPFAGTPDASTFPKANGGGVIHLSQKYRFNDSVAAQGALASITPLEDQHIVVHGGMAPASVDADAFAALGTPVTGPLDAVIYDVLLPVACGEITAHGASGGAHVKP